MNAFQDPRRLIRRINKAWILHLAGGKMQRPTVKQWRRYLRAVRRGGSTTWTDYA